MLGSLLCLLTGTMLGMLFRSSPAALVGVLRLISLLLPTVAGILASSQEWFRDLQPWVDAQLRPVVPLRGHPDRRAVGERRGHVRRCGWSCPRSSGSGWS